MSISVPSRAIDGVAGIYFHSSWCVRLAVNGHRMGSTLVDSQTGESAIVAFGCVIPLLGDREFESLSLQQRVGRTSKIVPTAAAGRISLEGMMKAEATRKPVATAGSPVAECHHDDTHRSCGIGPPARRGRGFLASSTRWSGSHTGDHRCVACSTGWAAPSPSCCRRQSLKLYRSDPTCRRKSGSLWYWSTRRFGALARPARQPRTSLEFLSDQDHLLCCCTVQLRKDLIDGAQRAALITGRLPNPSGRRPRDCAGRPVCTCRFGYALAKH